MDCLVKKNRKTNSHFIPWLLKTLNTKLCNWKKRKIIKKYKIFFSSPKSLCRNQKCLIKKRSFLVLIKFFWLSESCFLKKKNVLQLRKKSFVTMKVVFRKKKCVAIMKEKLCQNLQKNFPIKKQFFLHRKKNNKKTKSPKNNCTVKK